MKNSFELFSIVVNAEKCKNAIPLIEKLKTYHLNTYLHSVHVAVTALQIGDALSLDDSELQQLAMCGLLHDIGKLNIPTRILDKKTPLTPDEISCIRKHPCFSYDALHNCPDIVQYTGLLHHRFLDGTGYPDSGIDLNTDVPADIPLLTQIITVADIFCAITSPRAYKDTMSYNFALTELYRSAHEKKLDFHLVRALNDVIFFNKLLINTGNL